METGTVIYVHVIQCVYEDLGSLLKRIHTYQKDAFFIDEGSPVRQKFISGMIMAVESEYVSYLSLSEKPVSEPEDDYELWKTIIPPGWPYYEWVFCKQEIRPFSPTRSAPHCRLEQVL